MDHYILFIWSEAILDQNTALFEDYLASLCPSTQQYQCSLYFANQVAFLLKPNAIHTAIISKSTNYENIEWQGPLEKLNVKNILPKEVIPDSGNEFASKDFIEQICESLHSLADQLPAFGTYKLDVLLCSDVLKDASISEEPILAGAFYRLMRWHSARFAILMQSDLDKSRLDEWCEIINADILEESRPLDLGPALWRGSIQLQDSKVSENISFEGLELKLDLTENEDNFFVSQHLKEGIKQENSEHIVLSSRMQLIDQCSFASIPPYMISPLAFRLRLGRPNLLNEKSSEVLSYLLNKSEAALILRLGYSRINEKAKVEKKYCTNRWRKAVSACCIKDAESFISLFEDYITFAVTKSRQSNHVIAFPLWNPNSLDPSFYFNLVNFKTSRLESSVPGEAINADVCKNIFKEIPLINTSLFYKLIEKLKKLNMELYKKGSISSNDKLNREISSLWEEVKNVAKYPISNEGTTSDVKFEEIDPSDWPERMYLLRKQMKNEEEKQCHIPNALSGLGPKLPVQSVSFSSEDVKKYFLPSGELKNLTNAESIRPLSNVNQETSHGFDAVQNMKWPDVVKCIYPDLYYNSNDQSEEKETIGNQMVNFYVKHETASTCSKQQITQNFSIIIQGKSSPATKEFRSPSLRKPVSKFNKSTDVRENSDCKENSVRELITKKILSAARPSFSQSAVNRENTNKRDIVCQNSFRKGVKRKSEMPIRCSPRKKNPVNYKYSSNRGTDSSKNNRGSKSNNLPDLLRKKLRHAVATALENNGISLNDALFPQCGKKLFTICQAFAQDIPQNKGKTSEHLQKIADAHVKQVIEFERQKHQK